MGEGNMEPKTKRILLLERLTNDIDNFSREYEITFDDLIFVINELRKNILLSISKRIEDDKP